MAQYHVMATFNIDLSDEIATTDDAAQKFVSDLIEQIACDKEGFYVGIIRYWHERYTAMQADENNPNNNTNE